jgi:hypothetical protein
MVEKQVESRYQSMSELLVDLEVIADSTSPQGKKGEQLVICSLCGKKNPIQNTFSCPKCRKPNLCASHYDPHLRFCQQCKLDHEGQFPSLARTTGEKTGTFPAFPPLKERAL